MKTEAANPFETVIPVYQSIRHHALEEWNILQYRFRLTEFSDADRRDFLNVYIQQLRDHGYNDWIKNGECCINNDFVVLSS